MATSRAPAHRHTGRQTGRDRGDEPLIAAYDGVVCDLDGVVYRGGAAVPGAAETLQRLVAAGVGLVYATNNASRVPSDVSGQLSELGAPAGTDRVVTSAEAGAARLCAVLAPGSGVLALGGPGVALALGEAGLVAVPPGDAPRPGADVAAVLQGFGRGLTVADYEIAARHLRDGCPWVATNDDTTLPLEWGSAPGNGAYVGLLAGAVGRRPDVVGKPHAPLYELSLDRLGLGARRTLAVGDRLDTDIAGATRAGIASAWVLTGVDPPSALLTSTEASGPTYVIGGLHELLEPYAVPQRDGAGWACGEARARFEHGELRTEDGGSPIETARASLAAISRRGYAVPAGLLESAGHLLDEQFASTTEVTPSG